MTRRAALFHCSMALLAAAWSAGCERTAPPETRGPLIRSADLRPLALGRTTPTEIEARFGVPTIREPDGALTYRHERIQPLRRGVGPWTFPSGARVETRAVTFRFTHGVLTRICRSRS